MRRRSAHHHAAAARDRERSQLRVAPIFVELNTHAPITAKLPEETFELDDTACGLSSSDAATFFVVPIAVESHLTLAITADSLLRAGVLANSCPATTALAACGPRT